MSTETVQTITTVGLVIFCALTWWSSVTAWQDGQVYGNTPASVRWVWGQCLMGVGVTLVFVPLVGRSLLHEELPSDVRAWLGLVVISFCIAGKWFTRDGFRVHRHAAIIRRDGPPAAPLERT